MVGVRDTPGPRDGDSTDESFPPQSRRIRVWISAALLLAGTLAFAGSLALPAVTLGRDGRTMVVDGWTCAVRHGPTAGTNGFLVLAFAFWGAGRWFRSIWAWWLAAVLGVGAVLFHALIGAWPGYEGIRRLHSGYWIWLAATAVVAAACVVLPKPVRPPPGEPLPLEERDRGRRGLAAILASAATATILASHLFVPVPVASAIADGPPPAGERSYYYENGPVSSSGWQPEPRKILLSDGSTAEVERHYVHEWSPLVAAQFRDGPSAIVELWYLALPLLFVAAATTRRRAWRWSGAALAAAVAVACFVWVVSPWPCSGLVPHPLDVVWQAPPCALAVAFLLLPPRR